jgi:hypothetical protein
MKKLIVLALVLIMVFALAVPAMAADTPPIGTIVECNVGFHCGYEHGGKKMDNFFIARGIFNKGDKYKLVKITDTMWQLLETKFVCECGNSLWVSFSNSDSVFDGKDIQLCHKKPDGTPLTVSFDLDVSGNFVKTYNKIYHKPVYEKYGKNDTIILRDGTPLMNANKNRQHFGYFKINADAGTLALAVGDKKTYINVDVNYEIVDGELKLWFDEEKYTSIITKGVIAVVSSGLIDERAMDPGHARIGIGIDNAATALKAYSPNGNMNHKNAITWLNRGVQVDDYLFLHFDGLQLNGKIIGCEFDRKEGPFKKPAKHVNYEVVVYPVDDVGEIIGSHVYKGPFGTATWSSPDEYVEVGIYEYNYLVKIEVDGIPVDVPEPIIVKYTVVIDNFDGTLAVDVIESVLKNKADFIDVVVGTRPDRIICDICKPK